MATCPLYAGKLPSQVAESGGKNIPCNYEDYTVSAAGADAGVQRDAGKNEDRNENIVLPAGPTIHSWGPFESVLPNWCAPFLKITHPTKKDP